MGELKLKRKLFRLVGLLFPALYVGADRLHAGAGWVSATGLLVLFLAIMVTLEYARFHRPGVNRWVFDHFRDFTKEKERNRTSSTTQFLLACLLTILLFDKGVALAAMLLLVFGDPVAEIIGTRWGRTPLMGKSLEGTLGGLTACLLSMIPLAATGTGPTPSVLILGAFAAALFELLPSPLDDNFIIPLASGIVMTLAVAFGVGGTGGMLMMSPLIEGLLARSG
ncbi:MAG: diacylglycerol/polyprenol kinase family protein [Acidobacteriota bacterium]